MSVRPLSFRVDATGAGLPAAANPRLGDLKRWLDGPQWRAVLVLVLLCLACFLPGLTSIPVVDRDEARFTQSSKQMLETGEYLDIRFQDTTRYKKPIGIYWLQVAAAKVTGHGAEAPIWVYRLPSLLGAIAAVLLTYWAGLTLFGRTAAFLGAAALAVTPILVVEAHLAKTDAALLACVLLSLGALARLYIEPGAARLGHALTFWAGMGVGILIKGPIVPMVAGLTILALVIADRRAAWLRGLRPLIGVPLLAAIVLPWFIAILTIAGKDFLAESVGNDLVGKLASGSEGHGAPPGMHTLLFFALCAPAALLAPAAFGWVKRQWTEPTVRFCLAWIVPSFVVFEIVTTKLPHYPMPVYPAVCLLVAAVVAAGGLSANRILLRLPLISSLLTLVLVFAAFGFLIWDGGAGIGSVVAAMVAIGLAVVSFRMALRAEAAEAVAVQAVTMVPLAFLLFGGLLTQAGGHMMTPKLAAALDRSVTCPGRQVISAGYEEASLLFTAGTDIRFADAAGAAEFLKGAGCRVALVDGRREPAFLAAAAAAGLKLDRLDSVEGLNIGRVSMISVGLYTAAGSAP